MLKVAIDTSTKQAAIGVDTGDGQLRQASWHSRQNHCRELMPNLSKLIADAGARFADIGLIAVALGPGSFSAVRVGISTAIGLAMPHGVQVVGTPTYAVAAEPHWEAARSAGEPLYALLPAGTAEIAWFKLDGDLERPSASGLGAPEGLATSLPPGSRACGEACAMLGAEAARLKLLDDGEARSPASLLRIAERRMASGSGGAFDLRPIYAKPPTISKPRVDYPI